MGDATKAGGTHVAALGFLTVVENELFGLVGGYLLLNASGRPLEFHCTAPVKSSRAQQILYGPTLAPYLYGEQIAQALIHKAGIEPQIVWTDQPAVLAVREFIALPVAALVHGHEEPQCAEGFEADRELVANRITAFANFDLREPFDRIREAIEEAHRAATNRQAA